MTALLEQTTAWSDVCALEALVPGRGVAAMIDGTQIALFHFDGEVFALSNYDPFSDAYVISRGVVGSKGDTLKVASPVFKHNFCLRTGACLDDDAVSIPTYEVAVVDGRVLVAVS
jgi:nitrite reductase (NADH) small subunit